MEQIRGQIDRHRDEFLNRYIAVQIESEIEDGRTSNGQWYPRVVTIRGYERYIGRPEMRTPLNRVSRIQLIQENPSLPEALFDPDQLKQEGVR